METDEILLPQDLSAKLRAVTADIRTNTAGMMALEVKMIAARLFLYREQRSTRKIRKRARGIYHAFERIRRELVDNPKLDGQEALDPARDCIQDLLDLARETMDEPLQP